MLQALQGLLEPLAPRVLLEVKDQQVRLDQQVLRVQLVLDLQQVVQPIHS